MKAEPTLECTLHCFAQSGNAHEPAREAA